MSSTVNSFVNDKLRNDQLVYDFVRQKYRQIHPSLKQNITFVLKQMSRALHRSSKIERVRLEKHCVFLFVYLFSLRYPKSD